MKTGCFTFDNGGLEEEMQSVVPRSVPHGGLERDGRV